VCKIFWTERKEYVPLGVLLFIVYTTYVREERMLVLRDKYAGSVEVL
jgi:hypothetical protein